MHLRLKALAKKQGKYSFNLYLKIENVYRTVHTVCDCKL